MDGGTRWLLFHGRRTLVRTSAGAPAPALLAADDLPGRERDDFAVGALDGMAVRVADLGDDEPPTGTELREVRALLAALPRGEARRLLRALHVLEWGRTHRFCGRCGARNAEDPTELARLCPRCGHKAFPRISPAVIVLVRSGDRVLLGRGHHLPPGRFSTLAGFVEPGESLEETVRREIREEVGIEVAQIRYFGSQPWPFPDSLMVGFTAEHAGGEITVDPAELAEARWFGLGELPAVPPPFSIARDLIASWVRERGGDPDRIATW